MRELERFFEEYKSDEGRLTYKIKSYEPIYETFLEGYRNKEVTLVEFGVGYGGSLQMWRTYLGPEALIYGIDKDDARCYQEYRITCIQGDQGDISFLKSLPSRIPDIDVVIDDGSHVCKHQVDTFESMFPAIKRGGLYFCEDTHTSYRDEYGGGYKREGSFIEYCKGLVDALNHRESDAIPKPDFINEIESISFHRSLVMVKKS